MKRVLARLRALLPVFVWAGDVRGTAARLKAGAPLRWYGVAFGRIGFGVLHVGLAPRPDLT